MCPLLRPADDGMAMSLLYGITSSISHQKNQARLTQSISTHTHSLSRPHTLTHNLWAGLACRWLWADDLNRRRCMYLPYHTPSRYSTTSKSSDGMLCRSGYASHCTWHKPTSINTNTAVETSGQAPAALRSYRGICYDWRQLGQVLPRSRCFDSADVEGRRHILSRRRGGMSWNGMEGGSGIGWEGM